MSDEWSFVVCQDHYLPVYVQIENHVRFAISSGTLQPGDVLPSVRRLARRLAVNSNTVTKSYRDLEIQGILVAKRGVGVAVTPEGVAACRTQTHHTVLHRFRESIAECMSAGLSAAEIRKELREAVATDRTPYTELQQH